MVDETATVDFFRRYRRRRAFVGGIACAVLAFGLGAGSAAAGPKETPAAPAAPAAEDSHYQVYIGDPSQSYAFGGSPYTLERDWGSVRLTEPGEIPIAGGLRSPSLMDGGAGVTYFTPSLSGVRLGVGMSGTPNEAQAEDGGAAYSTLGPRVSPHGPSDKWKVGGKLGYSGLEIGANVGDHPDPTCEAGASCKTNDFWDIGVALRIGSGALSAAYTASQPRAMRSDEADRIDVFSLNAGYKLTPGMNVYGGVDWIDPHGNNEAAETPLDTRFMLGTNLRF